ncbi:MAG: outer membrane protein assembly factor BamD, partial [Deltaproteobacteria bacterium]|nr:outer membrane protein assembly factor BamD [Deltaproteobacteria bacterium]
MSIRRMIIFGLLVFLSTGCFAKKPGLEATRDAGELFAKGVDHFQRGQYEEAEKVFKMLMEDHPLSPYGVDAHLLLADLYYAKADYEDAASYYGSFATMHP